MPPGISTKPQGFTTEPSPQRPFPFHISQSPQISQEATSPCPNPSTILMHRQISPPSHLNPQPNPPSASISAEPNTYLVRVRTRLTGHIHIHTLRNSPNISEPSHGSAPNIRSVAAADHGPAFQRLE
nr:hypothetical protein L204_00600 [Cryptococcus depauperatus CBS 7855]